ncbi:MAG: cation:proton antiporter, partial [Victivallales bacterium]|nr:cation:proton antiporter [Victivallales bacterium]
IFQTVIGTADSASPGLQFIMCLLFGAIISSTDASAVFSILSSKRISLKGDLRPLLELESGSNDPMATFLTMAFLGMAVAVNSSNGVIGWKPFVLFLPGFVWQMAGGIVAGLLVAKAAVWLFNHLELDYDGLYYVLGMAVVMCAYSFAAVLQSNGFMAAYVCGLYMGNRHFVFRNSFGSFADAVGWLMQVILFTILGFKADLNLLWQLKWFGLAMAFILMFVARPIATWICMRGNRFSIRAKLLVSWVGLRGGAPIMLATFPMMESSMMEEITFRGITTTQPEIIFNLVFCLVLLSVVCQSFTIMPLARLLKLDAPMKMAPTAPLTFDRVRKSRTDDADDYDGNMPRDFTVGNDSELAGREIRSLGLPKTVFIIMVRRGSRYLVPRGNTVVHAGDVMTILGTAESLKETGKLFQSEE